MDPQIALALRTFSVTSCAGAIGGLVGGINSPAENTLRLLGRSLREGHRRPAHQIELGCIGDMLVGGAAGVAIVFFLSVGQGASPPADYVRLIPISLMAGVVSKRALAGMSEAIIGKLVSDTEQLREEQVKIQDQLQKLDHINELVQEGERYIKEGEAEKLDRTKQIAKYESARDTFLKAIEIDHSHSVGYVCLGKALKRLAADCGKAERMNLYREAIAAASEAIRVNPTYDRAYYNRACYKVLMGADASEVLPDLEKAVQLFGLNRLFAKSDSDFDAIRADPRFLALVGEEQTPR